MKRLFLSILLLALTQFVFGQIKVTDIPANLKPAVEWVYNNRFVARSAAAPIGEGSIVRQNLILDQIYDNGGYLNYVVRWQSSKSLTLVQRQKMQGFIERQINLWTKNLVGYENWPFDFIPVKIVGWAVDDASKILDKQPNEVVYTSFTRDGLADTDAAIYANLPNAPDQCSRMENWQNPNYTYQQCPQGPGGMFNMYLWATQGWNNGGAVGGDWGQRMSDVNYLNNLDAESHTIFVHELGHGFGITDFYGATERPPSGFPIPLVMWAGNSRTITDLDIWMLRYIWYYISQDKNRFPNLTTTTKYTLTTSIVGSGSVSPASGSFNSGSVQTLTATPANGFVFSGWSGGATGTTNPLSVTMNANKSITATFTAVPTYTLTTKTVGSGTVSPASGTFNQGSTQILTAKPASGFIFTGWTGDATGSSNPISVTLNGNKTVTATFTAIPVQTITYNVQMLPSTDYTPTVVSLNSAQIAQIFGITAAQVTSNFGTTIKYFGIKSDGSLDSVSTANAPGHWFDNTGNITTFGASPYVYSELNMTNLTTNVGQSPNVAKVGDVVSFKQALVYTKSASDVKQIILQFNVSIKSVITGIEDIENQNNISIYPNPFKNSFNVNVADNSTFVIFDSKGLEIEKGNIIGSVEMGRNLTKGLYLLKINQNDTESSFKIIKE